VSRFAAVDVGASGGRVMVGLVDEGQVVLEEAHRFPNGVVERAGHLRWDAERLLGEVERGLEECGGVESIGIDTWGVDYGLLDDDGVLVADPIAYRDSRTEDVLDDVHALVAPEELYAITGVQHLPFNTIYQLVAEQRGPVWGRAAQAVLLPDLIAAHLTGGRPWSELTNASTTALLDAGTGDWSKTLLDRLSIPFDLLPPVEPPGSFRGATARGVPVVSVGSHDTASAVVAVPAVTDRFAYVVSGTWSLVGLELDAPVLGDGARRANFTNERGVDGRVRFLRNVGGLWLLQECLRWWGRDDLDALLVAAAGVPTGGPVIDADDPAFIPPGGMPDRIVAAAGGGVRTEAEVVRCVLDSLAAGHARTLRTAMELSARAVDVVHLVGGGSQNALLCQLTADACGLPVVAGPVEATALGNVVVQARAAGALPSSLEEVRAGIAASAALRRYEPR
jgi:rhamnulokinase